MPLRVRGIRRQMHQSGLSPSYKRACDTWKKATDEMASAQRLFQKEKSISYDTFLSAQIKYKAAARRFDEAFAKETRRNTPCADSSENLTSGKKRTSA